MTQGSGSGSGSGAGAGVGAGAVCTQVLGKWAEGGNLGLAFAVLGGITALALIVQISVLRPVTDDMQ